MSQPSTETTTLEVDWSYSKWKALITNPSTQKQEYIVDVNWTSPDLVFKSIEKDTTIGTGNIHHFKIDAECEVHNHPIRIKALKRWKTQYNHLSQAYDPSNPTVLTWTSSSDFKHWDFVLLNPQQEPVARFTTNLWAVKKIGHVEFMGEPSLVLKEEVLVTGFTLYYCMLVRMNNLGSFFGAFFAKPGPVDVAEETERARLVQEKRLATNSQVELDETPAEGAKVKNV